MGKASPQTAEQEKMGKANPEPERITAQRRAYGDRPHLCVTICGMLPSLCQLGSGANVLQRITPTCNCKLEPVLHGAPQLFQLGSEQTCFHEAPQLCAASQATSFKPGIRHLHACAVRMPAIYVYAATHRRFVSELHIRLQTGGRYILRGAI